MYFFMQRLDVFLILKNNETQEVLGIFQHN